MQGKHVQASRRAWVGANATIEYGQKAEDVASAVDPEIAVYAELRDKIFSVADDLGVGTEIRTLYYGLATGQRVGGALSIVGASTPIVSGSAILSIAGTLSSLASIVGIVVGIVGLFSDDDEEWKRVQGVTEYWLRRQSIDDMIAAQNATASLVEQLRAASAKVPMSGVPGLEVKSSALRMAKLYAELKQALAPQELALFVSLSNLGRWQGYLDGWNRMKQGQRDAIRQNAPGFEQRLALAIAFEQGTAKDLAAKLQASGARLTRAPQGSSRGWVGPVLLVTGAGALALSFWQPALAASIWSSVARLAMGSWRYAGGLAHRTLGRI